MPRSEPQYVRTLCEARLIFTMWIQRLITTITSEVRLLLRKTKQRTRSWTLFKKELSRRLTPESIAQFMTGGRTVDLKYQKTRREASLISWWLKRRRYPPQANTTLGSSRRYLETTSRKKQNKLSSIRLLSKKPMCQRQTNIILSKV